MSHQLSAWDRMDNTQRRRAMIRRDRKGGDGNPAHAPGPLTVRKLGEPRSAARPVRDPRLSWVPLPTHPEPISVNGAQMWTEEADKRLPTEKQIDAYRNRQ